MSKFSISYNKSVNISFSNKSVIILNKSLSKYDICEAVNCNQSLKFIVSEIK